MKLHTRRQVLVRTGLLAAMVTSGLITARQARAAADEAFRAKTLDDVFKALGGAPAESAEIVLTSPDIAENGAVVPVTVTSTLPHTQQIHVVVEKNPFPLAASFFIPEGTEPYVATRAKMGQTTNVYALVKADGKLYLASKETKVTLGGCGG